MLYRFILARDVEQMSKIDPGKSDKSSGPFPRGFENEKATLTVQWQMSHARQPDVFQTGVLPPTQADSFLPRRSSLSTLTNDPANIRRLRSRRRRNSRLVQSAC